MATSTIKYRQPSERSGLFTALLALAIVAVVGVVFTAVAYFLADQFDSSQADLAANRVKVTLTDACNSYKLKNGDWPESLQALLETGEHGGPFLDNRDILLDPWGNTYCYDFHGPENDGARPDIWTVNPSNGAKIGNWPRRQ